MRLTPDPVEEWQAAEARARTALGADVAAPALAAAVRAELEQLSSAANAAKQARRDEKLEQRSAYEQDNLVRGGAELGVLTDRLTGSPARANECEVPGSGVQESGEKKVPVGHTRRARRIGGGLAELCTRFLGGPSTLLAGCAGSSHAPLSPSSRCSCPHPASPPPSPPAQGRDNNSNGFFFAALALFIGLPLALVAGAVATGYITPV